MIKLIASDLDGTLLQNGAQELSPKSISLIHQLVEKGIHFVAASGRQYENLYQLFSPIQDEIAYVAENGSLGIVQGKTLHRVAIEPALVNRILSELKKQDNFEIILSGERYCYMEDNNPAFTDHIVNVIKNTTRIVEDVSKVTDPILKIAICNLEEKRHIIDNYLKYLQDLFGDEIKVVTSGNIWIDFIAPNTNKGIALEKLMDYYSVLPEECVAFGDQYNDVEMLQTVGTSYAMANAAPGITYYSTHVTKSVDDVLADILNEL